jgi:hypothetical protein
LFDEAPPAVPETQFHANRYFDTLRRYFRLGAGISYTPSDKRSVLSYLLSPITRLSERAFRE